MGAEPVAILGGTGPQGRGLALRFARAGTPVVIGSRDGARAIQVADDLGGGAELPVRGAANAEAARAADLVFVTVPWEAHEATLRGLVSELAGRIVVDVVNPMIFDERGPFGVPVAEGSAAEQARAILPASTVVAGFHHVSAKHLLDETGDVATDILVCGDDAAAKARVMALADDLPGARAVDAGPLRLSGWLEGMTAVLLSINREYRTSAGLRLSHLDVSRRRSG